MRGSEASGEMVIIWIPPQTIW